MAKSPAQRQREYMERKKQKEARASNTLANVYKMPFYQFAENHLGASDFELCFALAGIEPPAFEDDRGPEHFVLNDATAGVDDPFSGAKGSLGRAEVMVGCLVTAAVELALCINRHKTAEINARLKELEDADLSDQAAKKAAFGEIARLNKMLDQLSKDVRWTFPQWKVTD